jgi:glycosyltransferase involved in cell wall biosynthesis
VGSDDPAVPVVILDKWDPSAVPATPSDFDVLAILAVYNEADIIGDVLDHLRRDGIRVHILDNWSEDETSAIVGKWAAKDSGVTVEQFPADGSSGFFELERILGRVEEIAHTSGADWAINYDADEIRTSPWPGISLRRGLYVADHFGFNCVDHTIVNFRPVDEAWDGQGHLADAFEWFEFGDSPSHFRQTKAWKPQPEPVNFAHLGGHDSAFPGRRVFPYKFVTRHYPIRSSAHGKRKILRERQQRWSPVERAKGWHVHYDGYSDQSNFLWDPSTLQRFAEVDQRQLLERLSGVGLPGGPYPRVEPAP